MKMEGFKYIFFVFILFFLDVSNADTDIITTCNTTELQRCLLRYADSVLDGTESMHQCSNVTSCVPENLTNCSRQFPPAITSMISQHVRLLQSMHENSCTNAHENQQCDLNDAKSCINDFLVLLTSGQLGGICRQASPVLQCLNPALDRCSGLPKYKVALVSDEIQLTFDLWCSQKSCRVDLASQCIANAIQSIDFPVAIEVQSNLICSSVRSSLACVTNHTEFCESNDIPQSLADGYMQLYQLLAAYCDNLADGMLSATPIDLISSVYLAVMAANEWTPLRDICSVFNATIVSAAAESISMTTNVETFLTWQQFFNLNLDKFSDICFNNQTLDCDWMIRFANENPVCDLKMAEECVDMVLLSKLTLEVNVMRNSWENVCSVAYNMLACAQYHTGSCVGTDTSTILELIQQVEHIVGYQCSQLVVSGDLGNCKNMQHSCAVSEVVHVCGVMAFNLEDRCQHHNEVYDCFHNHLHACNSVQTAPAQFYMEWLLNNCTHNLTLIAEDVYTGVAECEMQYGYNINNGIQIVSDFNSMICSVMMLYRQCVTDQFLSGIAVLYMKEIDDFYSTMQSSVCNNTTPGSDLTDLTELAGCELTETAGEVALTLVLYSSFPFLSISEQEEICRTYPPLKDTWTSRSSSCSYSRQTIISQAISYYDNMHTALCAVSRPDLQRSCDDTKANMCLNDFGSFIYFADANSNICGKLEETYQCLLDNTETCDQATHDALLQEVKIMHSLLGNITCPRMQWCQTYNTSHAFHWQHEICSEWDHCLIFDWLSCVDQYELYTSCQFLADGLTCIEQKLAACDPLHILLAKSEMSQWIQRNNAFCNFVPNDPASVTPIYKTMFECSFYISQTTDVTKQGICSAIEGYISCLAAVDTSGMLYVWRGILGTNGLLWRKHVYMDCHISNSDEFIVNSAFNPDNITGASCSVDSQICLRAFADLAVTYFHLLPISDRLPLVCERSKFQYDCVLDQASGCTNALDRTLLTSAEWIREGLDNVGTCSSDGQARHRECRPSEAMQCISHMALVLINDLESASVDTVCSNVHATSLCVNQKSSSCNYLIRADIAQTFNQIFSIVKSICSPVPPTAAPTSCVLSRETVQCDLEEALMCIVPVQARLLHPNSTWEEVCGSIPEMKACVSRWTSGCDEITLTIVSQRLYRLGHRLNDQCPQIYCEECAARLCLTELQRKLQVENVSVCGVVSDTKQCIYENAGHCDPAISDMLLREITLLVGQNVYLCEITLPSCMQTFMVSAFQITSYKRVTNTSVQNDQMLAPMCSEASTAFYCINQHLTSIQGQRLQLINSTLQTIGSIVYDTCRGPQLQCYSCVNSTSNEDCNLQRSQTCSIDMQMCGTVYTGTILNKGCVSAGLCHGGCNGTRCPMCCGTSLCNQPWNNVLFEPVSCQPETALYCGFQLISSLVQNETINSMMLHEALTCMVQSTQDCMALQSLALGVHARDLLTSEATSAYISQNSACGCGQCTSLLLLSAISSPFDDVDSFCRSVYDMYNRTLSEMDLTNCTIGSIQMTGYNLQMAAHMMQGICPVDTIGGECDVAGTQECIDRAALTYLMSMATPSNAQHVCLSAANLLKCIKPKVTSCPDNVLEVIRSAVWYNLNTIQSMCDVHSMIWSNWQIITSMPEIASICSVQEAVKCFSGTDDDHDDDKDDTCSSYQTMIDCVYNVSSTCLSVDVVPVLFELGRHLEDRFTYCDLVIPDQQSDPLYPIAQCIMRFGSSMNDELKFMYLQHGRLEGVCDTSAVLVTCLRNITDIPPVGKLLTHNLVGSLTNLVQLCEDWVEENQPDTDHLECQQCQGFVDLELCDTMPVQECQYNQACATSFQLDPASGVTIVTKGCASLAWCQMNHGCNPQFMSCSSCCHVNLCNSALNMTSHSTVTATTRPWRTTTTLHNKSTNGSQPCQVNHISTALMVHILRLLTFNYLPVYDRQLICRNYESEFMAISGNIDANCPEEITMHVQRMSDWLLTLTLDVCGTGSINDGQCKMASQCLGIVGNTTSKDSICRSLSEAMDCLESQYKHCSFPAQLSINSTRHVLSNMQFIICESNKLSGDHEEPECVSMATRKSINSTCNVTRAMECSSYLEKSFYNPFMTQQDVCRLAKHGIACIRDSTVNCRSYMFTHISPVVMEIIQGVSNICPGIWCPADEQCSLEPAWACLESLETEVSEIMNTETFVKRVCTSLTRTHNCIMNATENCRTAGVQRLFQHFNTISHLVTPLCSEEPTNRSQCMHSLHHNLDDLVNFDMDFVGSVLKSILRGVLINHVIKSDFNETMMQNGMAILGLDDTYRQDFGNNTMYQGINIPGVLGYLFKSQRLNSINLPSLSEFLSEIMHDKNMQDGPSNGVTYGINLPGGYLYSSSNVNSGQGGVSNIGGLPGVGSTSSSDSTTGGATESTSWYTHGLNLPGSGYGYYSTDEQTVFAINIDDNIEEITDILFRSYATDDLTDRDLSTRLIYRILKIFNKMPVDVPHMMHANIVLMYSQYKTQLCEAVHESLHCIHGNMHSSIITSSRKQEFVMTTTLRLLNDLAAEMCQVHQCYSCTGLQSNDECNMQPLTTCAPLQVCETRFTGARYYKGCTNALTCAEDCHSSNGQCYCCHGNQCNKYTVHGTVMCDTRRVVDAATDLLNNSFDVQDKNVESSTMLYKKAMELVLATDSCYGEYHRSFYIEGKRIIKLLEAENCSKCYTLPGCDIEGHVTLTNLVASPYQTAVSMQTLCSLFDNVLKETIASISTGKCCNIVAVTSLITIYQHIRPVCTSSSIDHLCDIQIHETCSKNLSKDDNTSSIATSTDSKKENDKNEIGDVDNEFCSRVRMKSQNRMNNQSDTDMKLCMSGCNVTNSLATCLGNDINNGSWSTVDELEEIVLCLQNHASGCCSSIQMIPVALALERILQYSDLRGGSNSSISHLIRLCYNKLLYHISSSIDIREPYHCLQELASVNVTPVAADSGDSVYIGVCKTLDSVYSCLQSTPVNRELLQSLYFRDVGEKLRRFTASLCTIEKIEEGFVIENKTCDITSLYERTLAHLAVVLTTPSMVWNDVCMDSVELATLQDNITECPRVYKETLSSILSWIQGEVEVACNANLPVDLCGQATCGLSSERSLMKQLGYFLSTYSFNDLVFCQKIRNVLHGVDCLAGSCGEETMSTVNASMSYVRSIVGTRCPHLNSHLYSNNNQIEDKSRSITDGGGQAGEECSVVQAQMCFFNVLLPKPSDALYCRKMVTAIEKLSKCVLPKISTCTSDEQDGMESYYRDVIMNYGPVCHMNFSRQLFKKQSDSDWNIPYCSHVAAFDCLTQLQPLEGQVCGTMKDVELCVQFATEGCNHIQQFAVTTSFETAAMLHGFPKECWENLTSISSTHLNICMFDFHNDMSHRLEGSKYATPSCDLLTSLFACLDMTLTSSDLPVVIIESMDDVMKGATQGVKLFCQLTDVGDLPEWEGERNDTCNVEAARSCVGSYMTNVLMAFAFSQDGKQLICNNLSVFRTCLSEVIPDCSGVERMQFLEIARIIESISQLSDMCSPVPITCSPEIAMECVTYLGHAVIQHSGNICWTLQNTELCIKQTTSGCDNLTQNSVLQIYKPISCLAYSMCPMAIQVADDVIGTPATCKHPTDMAAQTCNVTKALQCIENVYGDVNDPFSKEIQAICSKYDDSLTCFWKHSTPCEDDVSVMMVVNRLLELTTRVETICPLRHGLSCGGDNDTAKPTCNLDQLEKCVMQLHVVEELHSVQEQCLVRKDAMYCLSYSTISCSRITRLYARTKVLRAISNIVNTEENECDNIQQCAYNYMAYMNDTLARHAEHLVNVDTDSDYNKIPYDQDLYKCHARLEELSCMQSHVTQMPVHVSSVTESLLLYKDALFADSCAVLIGLRLDMHRCNRSCIKCLLNRTEGRDDLPMLLTFVNEKMNSSGSARAITASNFCRLFSQQKTYEDDLNTSCIDDPMALVWHKQHTSDMASLYSRYCDKPCNLTQADTCLRLLEDRIVTANDPCILYNETLACLEDSVTSCEGNVTSQYFNQSETLFSNSGSICYTMPAFEIQYKSSHLVTEGEILQNTVISVSMTTPVKDSCHGNSCYVEVYVRIEELLTSACSVGHDTPQVLMDNCVHIFSENTTTLTREFNFYPRVDYRVHPSHNVTVHVHARLWQDGTIAAGDTMATITMSIEIPDNEGACYLLSEPAVRTFDGLHYYSFNQGEYVLYQHSELPETVHVGLQRCRTATIVPCPCAVMIQSGDDVFVVDKCRRRGEASHPLQFQVYQNKKLTRGTEVYANKNRKIFQFVLPSGAIVSVKSAMYLLDVWIKPSALDWNRTSGLCGTYDGNQNNDLTMSDSVIQATDDVFIWRGNLLPTDFVNSWRPDTTLFGGVRESDSPAFTSAFRTKCMCTNDTCTPTDLIETCDFVSGEDITSRLDMYIVNRDGRAREKRQTQDVWSNIDYDPADPSDQFPTWPTSSGFTEASATQVCETAIIYHASWEICSVAIDTTSIISACVTQILLTDKDELVYASLEDMKIQCKLAVLSDPNIATLLGITQEQLLSYLLTLTCTNDCSNHGNCSNDVCQCDSSYQGDDCSVSMDTVPVLTSLSAYIYSGTEETGSLISTQVFVFGDGFENSNSVTCHVQLVEVSDTGYRITGGVTTSTAIFLTPGTLQCQLTGSLPLTALLLSVSNNAANQSNSLLYIIQDPVCYDCDPALQICNLQPTSCVIDGQCYAAGVYNPTDECLLCDPITNTWIYKPSSSCTTSSSSSTTSTSSIPSTTSSTPSTTSSTTSTTSSTHSTASATPSTTSSTPSTTSSTPSTTSSTPSSTSPISPTTDPTSPRTSLSFSTSSSTPPTQARLTTAPRQEGNTDRNTGSDKQTFNIVIITGACLAGVIIVTTVCFAYRLKRKDQRTSEAGSAQSSYWSLHKQGQTNPTYSRQEGQRPIAGDPVIQPHRVTPVYSATFSTDGLEGRPGPHAIYEDDPDLHAVNISIFDEGMDAGASTDRPVGTSHDVNYDNAGFIARSIVECVQDGRPVVDEEYDNAMNVVDHGVSWDHKEDASDTITSL